LREQYPTLPTASCWLVRYKAKGDGGWYHYYKLQSKEKIFSSREGKACSYQHCGKAGSDAFIEALHTIAV